MEDATIKKILSLSASGKTDEVRNLCTYIHDLSLLSKKTFTGKELKEFITRANQILNYIK